MSKMKFHKTLHQKFWTLLPGFHDKEQCVGDLINQYYSCHVTSECQKCKNKDICLTPEEGLELLKTTNVCLACDYAEKVKKDNSSQEYNYYDCSFCPLKVTEKDVAIIPEEYKKRYQKTDYWICLNGLYSYYCDLTMLNNTLVAIHDAYSYRELNDIIPRNCTDLLDKSVFLGLNKCIEDKNITFNNNKIIDTEYFQTYSIELEYKIKEVCLTIANLGVKKGVDWY